MVNGFERHILSPLASPSFLRQAMSKRQAMLRSMWSPFTAMFRDRHCAATASGLIVVRAGGGGRDDVAVARKSRSSLEDLLRIEASSNPETTTAGDKPQPDMAPPSNSSKESEPQTVVAFAADDNSNAACSRPPPRLGVGSGGGGGGAVLVRAPTVRVKVNRLAVLVPAARSRATRVTDAGLPAKRGSYWRIAAAGRGGAGERSEHFYQRPIPLGRRCRVQHLEEGPSQA